MHVQLNQFLFRIIYYEIIKNDIDLSMILSYRLNFLGLPTCFKNYLNFNPKANFLLVNSKMYSFVKLIII